MSSLLRQCCCDQGPTGPCQVCDFCDCECTKSITIAISGTYATSLRLEQSPGTCQFDVCSPYCSQRPEFVQVGDCLGVATVSGSLTLPLIQSSPAGSTVSISGTCSSATAPGCSEWAGFDAPLNVSFSSNTTQTDGRRQFQCFPMIQSALFSPCDVIRECTWNCQTSGGIECGAQWDYETQKRLIPPVESFARLRCNSGSQTGTLFIVPYVGNCKHPFKPCDGDSVLATGAPSIALGWSQQRDCPSNSTLTYNTSGWISCNVSIT